MVHSTAAIHAHVDGQRELLVRRLVEQRPEWIDARLNVAIVAQREELFVVSRIGFSLANDDRAERRLRTIGFGVDDRMRTGRLEHHFDGVAFRWRDEHRLGPLFALVLAHVGADELHLRTGDGEVVGPHIGCVEDVESDHVPPLYIERVVGLTVRQHRVAEAPHEHVARRVGVGHANSAVLDIDVVEDQNLFAIDLAVVGRVGRFHDVDAGSAEFARVPVVDVRVVPKHARIRELDRVLERLVRFDRGVRPIRNTIHSEIAVDTVRVQRGGVVGLVHERDLDRRPLRDLHDRPRDRAVVRVPANRHAVDRLADELHRHGEAVAVIQFDDRHGLRDGEALELVRLGHRAGDAVTGLGRRCRGRHMARRHR